MTELEILAFNCLFGMIVAECHTEAEALRGVEHLNMSMKECVRKHFECLLNVKGLTKQ